MENILKQLEREFPEALIDIRYSQMIQKYKVNYSHEHKFSISKQPVSLEYFFSEEELQDVEAIIKQIKKEEEEQ